MNIVVRKIYWDYEKEENWLNRMSAQGLALVDYHFCRYVFANCQPGEYIYRIELLEHIPSHPESRQYIEFMEENGAEMIASYMRWVYFRKKASDGGFEIYSDIRSKIKHYQRIHYLWTSVACIEFLIGLFNIMLGVSQMGKGDAVGYAFGGAGLVILLGIGLLALGHSVRKKIKKLKTEQAIWDK